MLRKDAFIWSVVATNTFEALKLAVRTAPILILPNFERPFEIECDASGGGVGAVLMQQKRPLSYFSKALHGRHRCPHMKKN